MGTRHRADASRAIGGINQLVQVATGSCRAAALHRLWPAHRDERQYLLNQASGLSQHLVVAASGRTKNKFADSGVDIAGDPLDDGARIADREMLLGIAAGASPVGLEQAGETGVVGPAKAERDAGAVMVVVDWPALGDSRRADRVDNCADILRCFTAGLPAGAEPRGAPDRRFGRAAYPHRQIELHRLWRDRSAAQVVVDAFEIDFVLAPQPANDFEPLVGLAAARLGVEVQSPPFGCQRAADPESGQQASFGQYVDRRALFGQQHWVAER